MYFFSRAATIFLLYLAVTIQPAPVDSAYAQGSQERVIRDIEIRGFSNISGLRRRGENYVFQAENFIGEKVRVVMNAATGEIVGLSRVMPQKK
jgi:hypothetical protein